MPNDRNVEISLNINPAGAVSGVEEAVKAFEDGKRRIEGLAGDMGSFDSAGIPQSSPVVQPPLGPSPAAGGGFSSFPQPTTDPGIPVGSGRLDQLRSQFQTLQQIAPNAPDVANMMGGRMITSALHASMKDPESAREYQELIESIRSLRGTVAEEGKNRKDDGGNLLQWLQANAMMNLGSQVIGNVQQGRLFSAAGTGIGGAVGLLGGPAGMALGSSIGGGLGGMIEQLMGGTGGARDFEKTITDMNQRFGLGNVGRLRNYRLGEENGYTGVESAGMIDQLRENRALSNPAMAGPLVQAIQEMTRALGLNAEATIEMAGIYSRSGGEKGAEGVRGYLTDVVGGAIRAGFESNIEQYADMMGSARMQAVQTTGQGVTDRAFGMLQDVMGGLTGGSSRTSGLFRDNTQLAGMGLQSFLSYGGTNDPYSTSAAYMRLAGISENALDSRFISPEQMAQNAQRSLGFTTNRLQQMSGMGADDFQARAAADPNFVQSLIAGNAGLQRQTSHIVSGFLGREATAGDLRTYEQLTNISAANGGQLPTGGADGRRVDALLKQLQSSPGDDMREKEAARHNRTMEVMSHFMGLQTRVDTWMIGIMEWLLKFDLDKVQAAILGGMDKMGAGVKWLLDNAPEWGKNIKNMSDRVIKWANDNNLLPGLRAGFDMIANLIKGAGRVGQQAAEAYGPLMQHPATRAIVGAGARVATDTLLPGVRMGAGLVRGIHDLFNDTPGTVTATPGYNTFSFAPGDVVSARQGGISGGATLTDLNLSLVQQTVLGGQWHREDQEQRSLSQDVLEKLHELTAKFQADTETAVSKQFPGMLDLLGSLNKAAAVRDGLLAKIEQHFPVAIAAIGAVQSAIAMMGGGAGGGAGGGHGGAGGGAFASGLFTGPSANIGGSSANHIDTKFSRSMSFEQIDQYFMQMARAYEQQGRRIEFSNSAVAGEVYDPNASAKERIELLRRAAAAHSHSVSRNYYSFDYYVPQGSDSRSGPSVAGAEMYLPSVAGGRVEYGTAGNYGNFATIYDANGNPIIKTGHGDNRRALPQGRSFAAAPAGGGGSYNPAVGQDFLNATDAIAQRLGTRPEYLLAAMGFETGGTFSPSVRNQAGSGATGLIQFMPSTARGLGTSTNALAGMSQTQQLQYVERYLRPYQGQLDSLEDVYMSILYPAAIGRGAGHTLFSRGTTAYRQNQGLDVNRDGRVTVGEATEKVRSYLPSQETLNRLPSYQGRASTAGPQSVTVNIAMNGSNLNPGDVERAARTGVETAAVDEFELRRNRDRNPRNTQPMSPVYG